MSRSTYLEVNLMLCSVHKLDFKPIKTIVLLLQGYLNLLSKLNIKQEKIVDIQKALQTADINQDRQLDFDEWRQDLKS